MATPLPREPRRGDPLDADWGRAVARALRSQRVSSGPGLRVSSGPDGTTISRAPGRGAKKEAAMAAICPQWRITAEPTDEEGVWRVRVAPGRAVVTDAALEDAGGAGDAADAHGADDDRAGFRSRTDAITVPGVSY